MILTHGANSIGNGVDFVIIGDEKYKYKKIGGLLWTTENLRNATAHAIDNEEQKIENGKLWQAYYLDEIDNLLVDGWRIPTYNDYLLLKSISEENRYFVSKEYGGENITGFNVPLCGYINQDGNYVNLNERCCYWTNDLYDSTSMKTILFKDTQFVNFEDWSFGTRTYLRDTALSVRLCKDV